MVYQLVYTSQAQSSIGAPTLEQISYLASGRNPEKDISGIIIFARKTILQLIEGPEADVQSLFSLVSRDTRHSDVMILAEGLGATREFQTPGMLFKHITNEEKIALVDRLANQGQNPIPDYFANVLPRNYAAA